MLSKTISVSVKVNSLIEKNIANAKLCARFVYEQGHIPLVPHLALQYFDEETERNKALECCLELLKLADELWAFYKTDDKVGGCIQMTDGMHLEIDKAWELKIPIYYKLIEKRR